MARITIFNEFRHERHDEEVRKLYPEGMHVTLEQGIRSSLPAASLEFRHALLDDPGHGLDQEVLDATDTLIWWGHQAHDEVADEVADRVQQAVLGGMGLIVLHSGHFSKPFRRLLGTNCSLKWRVAEDGSVSGTCAQVTRSLKGCRSTSNLSV